jgi:NADH-quinone oxidoreductase subunit B
VVDLGLPGFGVPLLAPLAPVRVAVSDGVRRADVWLLDLALACCSVEVAAALTAAGPAEAAATDAPATDGAATDGAATDGAATDGAATVGAATDAPATDAPATDTPAAGEGAAGGAVAGGPRPVLVVAGTCTDALAPAVRAAYDALPAGTQVVSFGACACSGGPYWDSYSVVPGVGDLVPVDLFVPGCPPRPEALVAAVLDLVVGPS